MEENNDQSAPAEVESTSDQSTEVENEQEEQVETPDPDAEPAEESDDEEIELDGEKYKIPKKLKDSFLRQQDYTRKTQEVAEHRRQVEEAQARVQQDQRAFQEAVQRQQANLQGYAQVAALDQKLQQYNGINWQALNQQDPVKAQELWFDFQQAKDQRGQLVTHISQREQQAAFERERAERQHLEQAQATIAREIKDWSPEKARSLIEFGKAAGYTPQELESIKDPRAVKILHDAMLYRQHVANATKKPPPTVAPTAIKTVKSQSGTTVNPDKMSADEWMRWRNKQVANRNRS